MQHGPACTQASCASLVKTISSVGTAEGEQLVPTGLFVGGGFIYVSTPTHLVRAPVAGGAIEVVAPASLTAAIVADDQNVYWTTLDQPGVYRMPHSGGPPVEVAPFVANAGGQGLFIDATNLYWTDNQSLWSAPIAGGAPVLVSATPSGWPGTLVDGHLFGTECTSVDVASSSAVVAGYDMIVDATHCYTFHGTSCAPSWACGDLVSIPIGGGAMKVLATGGGSGDATAFDGQRMMIDELGVYLRRDGAPQANTLIRVPTSGGSIADVTTDSVLAFEVAADTIYWATLANGPVLLKSMPKYAP